MAVKISSIQFYNYRGFYDGADYKYLISTENKNVLIYGENGSGKTSIYKGIKDFFNSSIKQVDFVKHNSSQEINSGFVEITFNDGSLEKFSEDGQSVPINEFIKTAATLQGFLTYKELLRTYFADEDQDEINLFDLLVNGILKGHELASLGKLNDAWNKLNSNIVDEKISTAKELLEREELTKEQSDDEIARAVEDDKIQIETFGEELQDLLKEINKEFNKLLKYFDENLVAELKCNHDQINDRKGLSNYKISCEVKHYNMQLTGHISILNEARLSAIAITIYLASILKNPTNSEFKILFLDDIFIGLDMSNRLPLLEIIKNEFKDWQVFITTYDRNLFEVAKNYIDSSSWLFIEMYYEEDHSIGCNRPIIISPSDSYYEKARKYFNKTSPNTFIDYPASANYLRKECERILKNLLFGKYTVKSNDKGDLVTRQELGDLKDSFIKLMKDLKFDISSCANIDTIIKTVLNPLSHDNLDKPIYKAELVEAFNLIDELKKITHKKLLGKNVQIDITTFKNGIIRTTYMRLTSDMYVLIKDNKYAISQCLLKPQYYKENGNEKLLANIPECNLNKAFDMIYFDFFGQKNTSKKYPDYYLFWKFRESQSGKFLKQLMADLSN